MKTTYWGSWSLPRWQFQSYSKPQYHAYTHVTLVPPNLKQELKFFKKTNPFVQCILGSRDRDVKRCELPGTRGLRTTRTTGERDRQKSKAISLSLGRVGLWSSLLQQLLKRSQGPMWGEGVMYWSDSMSPYKIRQPTCQRKLGKTRDRPALPSAGAKEQHTGALLILWVWPA